MSLGAPEDLQAIESCALCGGTERTVRFSEPPFSVVRCDACGLVYVTPRLRPDVLPEVYGDDYWRSDEPSARGYASAITACEMCSRWDAALDVLLEMAGARFTLPNRRYAAILAEYRSRSRASALELLATTAPTALRAQWARGLDANGDMFGSSAAREKKRAREEAEAARAPGARRAPA